MLRICKDKWHQNENILRDFIKENLEEINEDYWYKDIVKMTVEKILNDGNGDISWDTEKITEIDNGHYQGTLLYLIPEETYQPSADEYLMTYVYYGSCSGCDTLQNIKYCSDDTEETIKGYMTLCRDIIMNMKKPYNFWDDKEFEEVEFK